MFPSGVKTVDDDVEVTFT